MASTPHRYQRRNLAVADSGRTRFPVPVLSRVTDKHSQASSTSPPTAHHLLKLNQLVDTLKSLKRLISHYFDQISKQGESTLAGDVRRVYRRILLLYVKYRRRQNYEKRRMKPPIDEPDEDTDATTTRRHGPPSWTMKKIVSAQSLPFTRAGFDADHDGVEDFDEIALAATRDVANIQNHCVRLILDDHQMQLPVYGLQTSATSTTNATPTGSDPEIFLGCLARQLNEQTWNQLRSILATVNPSSN